MSEETVSVHLSDRVWQQRGKLLGFGAGVLLPLVLAGLFLVTQRGYGISDNPPTPPQVYTDF